MAGLAAGFCAGASVSGFTPDGITAGEAFGSGCVGFTAVFAAGAFGVGVGAGSSDFGTGTSITPPSFGIKTLPPFGSTVTV